MKQLTRFFLILMLAVPGLAQDTPPSFVMKVNSDFMELHVSVLDEKGKLVSGLSKENFKVTENGISQPITLFKHDDIPVSLGLVIDNSRSMEVRKARMDAAALSFVRQSNPDDETFIVHFDSDARLSRNFTTNLVDLEDTLAASKPFGQTAIYDALTVAINNMEKARHEKRAILLVTDGLDNASRTSLSQIIETVKHSRVTILIVGLLSAAEGEKAEEALIKIAEASGGRAYFPDDVEQARSMMERAAHDLRAQYTLGFVPKDPIHDGSWRSIRVEILPPIGSKQKLTAEYRHGYYRPDE
jgi:Ca-activated chloride channel homolog